MKRWKNKKRNGIYIPIAVYITSYGRDMIVRMSQNLKDYSIKHYNKDLYYYSDTDSCHTGITDINILNKFCKIDNVELGAFDIEAKFTKAKFIRQKTYIEEIDGKIKVTCAGLPKDLRDKVNFDNFKVGLKVPR